MVVRGRRLVVAIVWLWLYHGKELWPSNMWRCRGILDWPLDPGSKGCGFVSRQCLTLLSFSKTRHEQKGRWDRVRLESLILEELWTQRSFGTRFAPLWTGPFTWQCADPVRYREGSCNAEFRMAKLQMLICFKMQVFGWEGGGWCRLERWFSVFFYIFLIFLFQVRVFIFLFFPPPPFFLFFLILSMQNENTLHNIIFLWQCPTFIFC